MITKVIHIHSTCGVSRMDLIWQLDNHFHASCYTWPYIHVHTLRIPGSVMVAYALTPTSAASPRAMGLSGATEPAASCITQVHSNMSKSIRLLRSYLVCRMRKYSSSCYTYSTLSPAALRMPTVMLTCCCESWLVFPPERCTASYLTDTSSTPSLLVLSVEPCNIHVRLFCSKRHLA